MNFDKYFIKLLKLKECSILRQITLTFDQYNYLDHFIEEIDIEFSDEEISTFGDDELLYRYLLVWKKIAQTSLNNYKNRLYKDECKINVRPSGKSPVENESWQMYNRCMAENKFDDKNIIAQFIFKYIFIFSLISNKEWKEQCFYCASVLPRNGNKCLNCSSNFDSKRNIKAKANNKVIINIKEKIVRSNSNLCSYCDNELINGNCSICGSNFSDILNDKIDNQNLITNENYVANDETLEMSVNGCNVSDTSNSPMTTDNSSYWICIMCTFKNDGDNENCFACMSEKSEDTKVINSTNTDSIDDKYISSNTHQNQSSIGYLQFWECKNCEFKNKISDYHCEVCESVKDFERDMKFSLPEEMWLCKKCYNNNTFDHYKCNECNELADFVNKWRCEKCSFINEKLEFNCGACEIKNPNLIKCLKCNKKDINKKYDKMCSLCILKVEIVPKDEGKEEIVRKQVYEEQNKINRKRIINKPAKRSGSSSVVFNSSDSDKAITIADSQSKLLDHTNTKKLCMKCKDLLESPGNTWCQKCELNRWYCYNTNCCAINFKNKNKIKQFCSKCKVEINADLSNCKCVLVLNNSIETLMWQCEICKKFNHQCKHKCHCGNLRPCGNYIKCHCKWNNFKFKTSCRSCGSKL